MISLSIFFARIGLRRLLVEHLGPHCRPCDPGRGWRRLSTELRRSSATSSRRRRSAWRSGSFRPSSASAAASGIVLSGLIVDHALLALDLHRRRRRDRRSRSYSCTSFVPESPIKTPSRVDFVGASLLSAGLDRDAARAHGGRELGLDVCAAPSGSAQQRCSSSWRSGSGRAEGSRADGRHAHARDSAGAVHERDRVDRGLRDVRVLRARAELRRDTARAAAAGAAARRLRIRCHARRRPGCTSCRARSRSFSPVRSRG